MDDGECTELLHGIRKTTDFARPIGQRDEFQGPAGALRETTQSRRADPAAQPTR